MIQEISKGKALLIVNIGSGKNRKRRVKTVTYKTKRELRNMYDDFEAEVKKVPHNEITVKQLVDNYIRKKSALGIKATTIRGYRTCAQRLDSLLGGFSADSLTTYQLENFVALNVDKSFKGYSPKTIANTISLLSSAYEDAIRTGQLSHNPCRNVTLPKRDRKEIEVFSEDEIRRFVQALESERIDYKVGYKLCLFCGLRRSEVLGLKEENINLEERTISIVRTRHRVNGELVEQDPKTARSRRTLALPEFLVSDVAELLEARHSFQYEQSPYLIQDGFGNEMNPSSFTRQIHLIEEKAGLPKLSVHGLRHTFASMLNSQQIDIARISAELGHSNISTTLNVYTHVFGGATASSRGIADAISSKFGDSATFLPQGGNKKTAEH